MGRMSQVAGTSTGNADGALHAQSMLDEPADTVFLEMKRTRFFGDVCRPRGTAELGISE